ncbi:MAG: hypothetical protein ACXWNC_04120 [Anaerolineales bacterium]
MDESKSELKRLDIYSFEMIMALAVITLHDFLLSNFVSLPIALHRSTLVAVRSMDKVATSLEYLVPIVSLIILLILWVTRKNVWERRVAIIYLGWVTLRMVIKIGLVIFIISSRPQTGVGVLLKDTLVLWVVNFVLFGVWYWIIDAGGPCARRDGLTRCYDFAFPQQALLLTGWEDWHAGFWDYVFLGFSSNTQFGLGDTQVLSLRAKFLLMLQITMSMAVIVFMASIAITMLR